MNKNAIIQTHNLSRRFDRLLAVDQLNLTVQAGEVFGFLGHNGAGKTTTIRLLNGVLAPSDGAAQVLGLSPAKDGPVLRRRTGVLTETPSLDERLTGRDNLTIFADLFGVPEMEVGRRVDALLDTFELSHRAGERVSGYSKGMKQRLALARALLHRPDLLFLDEPTAGLDPVAARRVHALITHLSRREGRTVFLCTHNLVEAQKLCDRVGVMEKGRLLAVGTPAELINQTRRTHRLLIETDPERQEQAAGIIQTMPGLTVEMGDDGFLTVIGAERPAVPDLLQKLMAAGCPLYRAAPQDPSLADVYFALHSGDLHSGDFQNGDFQFPEDRP